MTPAPRRGGRALLAGLLLSGPAALGAQDPDSLPGFGSRVRVYAPDAPLFRLEGPVLGWRGDTLLLSVRGAPERVRLLEIESMEVWRGRDRTRWGGRGALAGAALLGGTYLLEARDHRYGPQGKHLLTSALWGAAAGAVAGVALAPSRWETVLRRTPAAPPAGLPAAAAAPRPEPRVQQPAAPGARVRVSAPGVGRTTGRVAGLRGDTLLLRTAAGEAAVPLGPVRTVEVSKGRSAWRGAAVGAAAGGAVLGTFLALVAPEPRGCDYLCFNRPQGFVIGAVLGAVPGGVLGALIGREEWERLPVGAVVGLGPAAAGGVAVSARVPVSAR